MENTGFSRAFGRWPMTWRHVSDGRGCIVASGILLEPANEYNGFEGSDDPCKDLLWVPHEVRYLWLLANQLKSHALSPF